MEGAYCSISEAMKLINQPFDGDKRKLKEFIDNVSTAFELVHPEQHDLLLKCVKTKITGETRSKLLVRDLTTTWRDVKQILEQNYDVTSWSSRIVAMQLQLREAAYRICAEEELVRAMGLINHFAKACFVQGLSNERIQTTVRAKGETALLSVCIDAAVEEESAILSAKERGFTAPRSSAGNAFRGPGRGSGFTTLEGNKGSSIGNAFRRPGRGSGFTTLGGNRGFRHPGRWVGFGTNGSTVRRAHVVAEDVAREHVIMNNHEIRCHACGALGHRSRNCRKRGNAMWKDNKVTGSEDRGAAPLETFPNDIRLHQEGDYGDEHGYCRNRYWG
jgi:hypothetical protein